MTSGGSTGALSPLFESEKKSLFNQHKVVLFTCCILFHDLVGGMTLIGTQPPGGLQHQEDIGRVKVRGERSSQGETSHTRQENEVVAEVNTTQQVHCKIKALIRGR